MSCTSTNDTQIRQINKDSKQKIEKIRNDLKPIKDTKHKFDEYVIHELSSNVAEMESVQEIDDFSYNDEPLQVRNIPRGGDCNIYLQQVPRISRCNVQLSFEGVYDNENSDLFPTRNQPLLNQSPVTTKPASLNSACSTVPNSLKILLLLLGLLLTSSAIVAWIIAFTDLQSNGELINL